MQPQFTLELTAYTLDQIPVLDVPQAALAGRSNVGKSSLLNRLAGRKQLAKTSSTPGKTRSLNFYRVEPPGFYLVDLPGYGYARCSKKEREHWAKMTEAYLRDNPSLRLVVLLLDSRLTPQALDVELASYVRHLGLPVLPVLTKADKTKQKDQAQRRQEWRGLLPGSDPLLVSSQTGVGFNRLWAALHQAFAPDTAG